MNLKKKNNEELAIILKDAKRKRAELQDLDPFWFYKPSTGEIPESRMTFLKEYLKEEDIPQRLDGQLDAHMSISDIIGMSGGNQSGKSTQGAIEDYIQATGEVPRSMKDVYPKEKLPTKFPQRLRVVGVSYDQMMNTVLPTYQKWVPRKYLKKGTWSDSFSSEQKKLFLFRGDKEIASIEFKTNQQDVETFQGPPLDKVTYDEEPRHDVYKENLLRFVTADRLRVQFNWTPTKGLSWASELFTQGEDDEGRVLDRYQICSITNEKANLTALKSILDEITDYNELKMRLLGEFVSLSGLVYGSLFNRKIHVIDPIDTSTYELKRKFYREYIVYRGLDPHTVKPTVGVEIAVDKEGFEYVCGTYSKQADTEVIKEDLADRAVERGYRLGWTRCDKSADSTIHALGGRNIFLELGRGRNAIPGLFTSEKYTGSVHAGVDVIKRLLKIDPATESPRLFIFNIPENKLLINAMQTMERDTHANEDKKGLKDRIAEGKHDTHAALRYPHQWIMNWLPEKEVRPEPVSEDVYV